MQLVAREKNRAIVYESQSNVIHSIDFSRGKWKIKKKAEQNKHL